MAFAAAQDDYDKRYALMLATTPALQADGWLDLETAPHDGTEVEIRVVNYLAPAYDDERPNRYVAVCRAHWIDHNGGGFTWYGLCGAPSHWRHLTRRQPPWRHSSDNTETTTPQT